MEIENVLELDQNGHLLDFKLWSKSMALEWAKQDGLKLSAEHWLIIELVREIYLQTETTPPMRLLIKTIKNQIGEGLANSRKLYQLFPEGPVRLASKYAGLPKPKHCM
jgi:tRNA 2-thiouridine synthesizing protein E